MTRDEARRLMGGYAVDALTDDERKALFAAALEDQELFDELADEDVLKRLIETPGVRDRLLAALTPKPKPQNLRSWWLRSWPIAGLAGTAAVAVLWFAIPQATEQNPGIASSRAPSAKGQDPAPVPPVSPVQRAEPTSVQIAENRQPVNDAPVAPPQTFAARKAPASSSSPVNPPGQTQLQPLTIAEADRRSRQDQGLPILGFAPLAAPPKPAGIAPPIGAADASQLKAETENTTPAPQGVVITGSPNDTVAIASAPASASVADQSTTKSAVAREALPSLALGQAKGGAKGGNAPAARANLLPGTAAFGFRYQVIQGFVQITPTAAGILTVRALEQNSPLELFSRQVPASVGVDIPVPPSARRLVVEFASSVVLATMAVDQRSETTGIVTIPASTTGPNVVIVNLPAQP